MALSVADVKSALDEGDEGVRLGAIARLDLVERGALPLLARAMADHDWRVRREAVERVLDGTLPRESLAQFVLPLLADPDDVSLRNAAVEVAVALGVVGLPALHAELALRPAHRKILCDVLGRVGAGLSALPLAGMLDDEDENVRIAAAEALGRLDREGGLYPNDDAALARTLLGALDALLTATDLDRSAFFGSALLDALARRGVPLSAERLAVLTRAKVLGVGALRAVASGAVATDAAERNAARAVATRFLGDTVRARREAALLAVARLANHNDVVTLDPAARAGAIEAVLEGTLEVQRAAACVLGVSGDPVAARALLVALDDPAIAGAATEGLYLLARRDAGALVSTAETLGEAARAAVYRAIARSGAEVSDKHASAALLAALKRDLAADDDALAIAAGEVLGALGEGDAAAALAESLADAEDQGRDDRATAARRALVALAKRHAQAVVSLTRDRNGASFVALLGELGGAEDVDELVARLGDEAVEVRQAAVGALAALAARGLALPVDALGRAIEAARTGLVDEAPVVRAAAAGAVARLESLRAEPSSGAVAALLLAARDEDMRVRGAATRALIDLGKRARGDAAAMSRDGLRVMADSTDGLTAVPALEALLALGEEADDARLLDALTGADEERRKVALYALAGRPRLLGRGDLLKVAERALHDTRWDLRRAAIAAFAALGEAGRPALIARRAIEADALARADLDRVLAAPQGRR